MNEFIEPIRGQLAAGREELMTARQVARWLGMSTKWVYAHASGRRKPVLASIPFGRSRRFKPSQVEAFIELLRRDQNAWTMRVH